MSQTTIQSAKDRFALVNTGFSGHTITDFKLVSGYGISWKSDGVGASAQIPEIADGDADYIATFKSLMGGAGGSNNITSATSNPIMTIAILAAVFVAVRWMY